MLRLRLRHLQRNNCSMGRRLLAVGLFQGRRLLILPRLLLLLRQRRRHLAAMRLLERTDIRASKKQSRMLVRRFGIESRHRVAKPGDL